MNAEIITIVTVGVALAGVGVALKAPPVFLDTD